MFEPIWFRLNYIFQTQLKKQSFVKEEEKISEIISHGAIYNDGLLNDYEK